MASRKRHTILLIEDEQDIAKLFTRRLQANGYTVHAEGSATPALQYADQHRPDLIILDLCLPDIGGFELCQALCRVLQPSVPPILMLTAMSEPEHKRLGLAAGADAYLTKPCDAQELLQTIARLLHEKAGARRPV